MQAHSFFHAPTSSGGAASSSSRNMIRARTSSAPALPPICVGLVLPSSLVTMTIPSRSTTGVRQFFPTSELARREEPEQRHTSEGDRGGDNPNSVERSLAAVLQEPLRPTRRQAEGIEPLREHHTCSKKR